MGEEGKRLKNVGQIDVSVIIPVYNIQQHLEQCLDSVLGQTFSNFQLICVDDGSTDDSPVILNRYANQDARVQVIRQENAGPGAARNVGLSAAVGEYVMFLDSDDWFEPELLQRLYQAAREKNADITMCRSDEFDTQTGQFSDGEWMLKSRYLQKHTFAPREMAPYLFQFTYGWPWDKLFRRQFLVEQHLQFPALRNSEDLVFVFQSLTLAGTITVLDDVLVHHRTQRKDSVSNSLYLAPEVPARALFTLKKQLEQRGVYQEFEQTFLNWAMEFLVWNVANIGAVGPQKTYFHKMKREWLPLMEFQKHPRSYYHNRMGYYKYLLARFAPWPVFRLVLAGYKRAVHGGGT